jgi:uncharacterized glyoxalase superfamily protein PhnB
MSFSPVGLIPLIGVFDMTTSLAFYRDVLGFAVLSASPEVETAEGKFSHWVWLQFGEAEIMLNTQFDSNERPLEAPQTTPKDVVFYISCSNVELAYTELTGRGLQAPPPQMAPYGLRVFSSKDPDGYTIVFQEAPSLSRHSS